MKFRLSTFFRNHRRRKAKAPLYRTFSLAVLFVLLAFSVYATISGTWSINGNQSASTVVNGVTINWNGVTGPIGYANATFSTSSNYWTDPYNSVVSGGPALFMRFTPFGVNRTITVTFSSPVDDPVLHIDHFGGSNGSTASTAILTLSSFSAASPDVSITRLSGNPALIVNTTAKSFQRATGGNDNGQKCKDRADQGKGCGSIQFNGTSITSLTFNVTWGGQDNGAEGDFLKVRWSIGTTIVVRKQSVNLTGIFNFTGTNGVGSFSLNTAAANPATSAKYPTLDSSQNITITESPAAGSVLTSVTCRDPAGNVVPSSRSGLTATLTPANYASVNQVVTCTFVNLPNQPIVGLVKSCTAPANCTTAPQLSGTVLNYSIQFTNTGGLSAASLIVVDPVPANADFQLGSASVSPGTTGLTFVTEYSANYNPSNPSAATWNYTPVSGGGGAPAGFDRLVRAIRWRVTSGVLSPSAPNNTGNLGFRVRIR